MSMERLMETLDEALFRMIVREELAELWADVYGMALDEARSHVNLFFQYIEGITSPTEEEENTAELFSEECDDDDSGRDG